ncbi:MAG: hypothetical protein V5A91_05510, partial [Candidatus Accumulibacter necessarius]
MFGPILSPGVANQDKCEAADDDISDELNVTLSIEEIEQWFEIPAEFLSKRLAHPPVKPGRSGATSRFSTGGRDGQGRGTGSALAGACGRL